MLIEHFLCIGVQFLIVARAVDPALADGISGLLNQIIRAEEAGEPRVQITHVRGIFFPLAELNASEDLKLLMDIVQAGLQNLYRFLVDLLGKFQRIIVLLSGILVTALDLPAVLRAHLRITGIGLVLPGVEGLTVFLCQLCQLIQTAVADTVRVAVDDLGQIVHAGRELRKLLRHLFADFFLRFAHGIL